MSSYMDAREDAIRREYGIAYGPAGRRGAKMFEAGVRWAAEQALQEAAQARLAGRIAPADAMADVAHLLLAELPEVSP